MGVSPLFARIVALTALLVSGPVCAEPVLYDSEAAYLAALGAMGYTATHESFENDTVWGPSRNSIVAPGSTGSIISNQVRWTSNYPQNNIATGDVGGSAPDGTYAIYSLPHGYTVDSPSELACDVGDVLPEHCYQNDGLKIQTANGERLFGFGGRIDTANSGKITFILDGVDMFESTPDNIGNWQREGEFADNWTFIGVIDVDGFLAAELREIRGKDWQQIFMFSDDFTIGVAPIGLDTDGDGIRDGLDPSPVGMNNNSCDPVGPDTLGGLSIAGETVYCASQAGVNVLGSVQIVDSGELRVISPAVAFAPGFAVGPGGRLVVYSEPVP